MNIKESAKEIRAILKDTFPSTKFSVKCSRFSQGSSIDTSWIDGPTTAQVDALISRYGNDLTRFIKTTRKYSAEMVNKAIATWKERNPQYACLTITCEGETSYSAEFNLSEFSDKFDLQDCERSLYDIIFDSAFNGTNLIRLQKDVDDCESETVSTPEFKLAAVAEKVTPQPQPSQLDQTASDTLKADRQQAYAQYLASQQEADALEAKLSVKKTEARVYFAIMKEIDEQIEAKKREAEVITTEQDQPDFDVRRLESKKVTLILINTMGFPVSRHITVIAADIVSAKRYHGEMTDKKCLELQYVEKGKRKPKGTRYTEASLAVALGWQDIRVPTNNGYINAFDTGLLDVMTSQAKDVVYTQ